VAVQLLMSLYFKHKSALQSSMWEVELGKLISVVHQFVGYMQMNLLLTIKFINFLWNFHNCFASYHQICFGIIFKFSSSDGDHTITSNAYYMVPSVFQLVWKDYGRMLFATSFSDQRNHRSFIIHDRFRGPRLNQPSNTIILNQIIRISQSTTAAKMDPQLFTTVSTTVINAPNLLMSCR
jgi:hypothetical protein